MHDRAPSASVGVIVHLPLLVDGKIPNLPAVHPNKAPFLGTAQHRFAEHIPYHVGEQSHNVDSVHDVSSCFSPWTEPH